MAADQPQGIAAEPEFITPELRARWERLKTLMTSNQRLEAELRQLGQRFGAQVGIEPASVLQIRFQLLIDMLWPPDTAEGQDKRLEHDERFQAAASGLLATAKSQVTQQMLAAGATVQDGWLEQMAGQQGIPAGLAKGKAGSRRRRG